MRRGHPFRLFSALRSDARGTSAIELSLILPVLMLLVCGASDVGMAYGKQLKLQQVAARTMELASATGPGSGTLSTTIQNEASAAAGVPTTSVTPDVWLECDGVRQPAGTTSCASGVPSRYASVTILDTYSWMFGAILPTGSSANLKGFAEVRLQ